MGKIKIKKSELDRIIKEETLKFKQAIVLKEELKKINGELNKLNEVEAGATEAPTGGGNLTAAETQFVKDKFQHKAKFHNPAKNPNTMMEDAEDIEDTDMEDTDLNSDMDSDSGSIDKAAVLKAIEDLKMALNLHGGDESEEGEANDEEVSNDDEEFEFDNDNEGGSEEGTPEGSVEDLEGGSEEGSEEGTPEGGSEEGAPEGSSEEGAPEGDVEPDGDADDIDENKTLMEAEKKRMAVLAGIIKG